MDPLVEYETTVDAPIVDAGDVTPAPEPVAAEPAAPAAAEPAPPADPFDGIDLDALRALAEAAPHLLVGPPAPTAPQPQQDGPPDFDPLDPDSLGARLEWERQQTLAAIQELVNPLAERAQHEAATEQQALLKDAAHDTEQRLGEFIDGEDSRKDMLAVAREIFGEVSQKYGQTDRAAEIALERAHGVVAEREKRIGEAYHERKMNELKTLSGARTEPPVRGAAGETVGEYKNEMEALEAFLARTNAAA